MIYGRGRHRWKRDEIAKGVWISLGLNTGHGDVVEVTPRKFFHFNMINGSANTRGREFTSSKAFSFDKLVVSREPAGKVADVLHNGARQDIKISATVMVTAYWDENRTWGGEID